MRDDYQCLLDIREGIERIQSPRTSKHAVNRSTFWEDTNCTNSHEFVVIRAIRVKPGLRPASLTISWLLDVNLILASQKIHCCLAAPLRHEGEPGPADRSGLWRSRTSQVAGSPLSFSLPPPCFSIRALKSRFFSAPPVFNSAPGAIKCVGHGRRRGPAPFSAASLPSPRKK
jgi:hypothetical protein